ncbi:hypothetical protein [Cupriavidus sp. TMH.W2]|uniref:hypothetical protein n=1 Tax=Cupriavidus sp. TMH.W2 TaxID=3434465 RepID=UPI003D7883BC
MQQAERVKFAEGASARARALLGTPAVGGFYTDVLQQKIVEMLKAVDRWSVAAGDTPLIVPDILNGFDLMVGKPQGVSIRLDDAPADQRAAAPLDANTRDLLSQLADEAFGQFAQGGAFAYQSQDGLYYFFIRSESRDYALQQMGILPNELTVVGESKELQ